MADGGCAGCRQSCWRCRARRRRSVRSPRWSSRGRGGTSWDDGIAGAALAALSAQLFLFLVIMLVVSGLIGRGGTDLDWHTLFLRAGVYLPLSIGLALFLTRADLARLGELFRSLGSRAQAVAR